MVDLLNTSQRVCIFQCTLRHAADQHIVTCARTHVRDAAGRADHLHGAAHTCSTCHILGELQLLLEMTMTACAAAMPSLLVLQDTGRSIQELLSCYGCRAPSMFAG